MNEERSSSDNDITKNGASSSIPMMPPPPPTILPEPQIQADKIEATPPPSPPQQQSTQIDEVIISSSNDAESRSGCSSEINQIAEKHIYPPEILIYQPTPEFTETRRYRKVDDKIRISNRILLRAIGPDYLRSLGNGRKCMLDIDPKSQLVFQPYWCQDQEIPEMDIFNFPTDRFQGELEERMHDVYNLIET